MEENLVEFLKPDKRKILISFLIPYFMPLHTIFKSIRLYYFISPELLAMSILVYPFTCSIFLTIDYYRAGKVKEIIRDRSLLILVFIGLLFFNPISLNIMGIFWYLIKLVLPITPFRGGIEIVKVAPNSVAENMGLKAHDVITDVRIWRDNELILDTPITNSTEFLEIVSYLKTGDTISVSVLGGNFYSKRLEQLENSTIEGLGIEVRDAKYKSPKNV